MSISALRRINSALPVRSCGERISASGLLFFAFLAGLVLGSLLGLGYGHDSAVFSLADDSSIFGSAWPYFAMMLVFSTSYLGALGIPAVLFVRGLLFSCGVALMYSALGTQGLLLSFLGSGIPLCFLLPGMILVGADCSRCCIQLFRLRTGKGACFEELFPLRHLVLMIFLILLDAVYSAYLFPALYSALV